MPRNDTGETPPYRTATAGGSGMGSRQECRSYGGGWQRWGRDGSVPEAHECRWYGGGGLGGESLEV